MKKCAACDFDYDDAYDGCPQCARPPGPAPVKVGFPKGFLLVLVIIAGLVAFASFGSGLLGRDTYTLAQFSQVQTGMSVGQVQSVMGAPGTLTVNQNVAGYTGQIYQWQNSGGGNVIVQFQNGAVIQKAQAGLR